jgi:hypothetical protein
MSEPTESEITRLAYELWEKAGCPEGQDKHFYYQAEQALLNGEERIPKRAPDSLQAGMQR